MEIDLYFHGDFDGIASAVIFAHEYYRAIPINLHPVNYNIDRWQHHKFNIHNLNCVVDFPFSEALEDCVAWVWYDHHNYENLKLPKHPRGFHRYDPSAVSCAELVFKDFPHPRMEELMYWARVVDGALYENPKQVLLPEEPALQISASVPSGNNAYRCELVQWLVQDSIEEVARKPEVQERLTKTVRRNVRAIEWLRRHPKFFGEKVFLADFEGAGISSRYAAFFLYPQIEYCLLWRKINKEQFELSISVNPWNPPKRLVDVSKIARVLGGGGHEKAAGVLLPNTPETKRKIEVIGKFLQEVVE